MVHRNAPLSPEGRRRLIARCRTRPIAHVAAEMGISRACASKWVNRRRRYGEAGLQDRPSTPHSSPTATPPEVIQQIEAWRREHKWSARRITDELADVGVVMDRRTVSRHLSRLGPGRRRFIDPSGGTDRRPGKIIARRPGHMVPLDVKKVGGYINLHSIADGHSRLAYTEPLDDEKGSTAAAFLARARVWFAAHGINHILRIVTDNGACYRSCDFAWIVGNQTRHQKTKACTPRHNGRWNATSASWPKSCSTPETSPAKTRDRLRSPSGTSTTTITGRTAAPTTSRRHHASAAASPTSSPRTPRVAG